MAKKTKKAGKLTSFEAFKKEYAPGSPFGDLLAEMKPLGVPSEKQILDQMKNSGHPMLESFATDLEREKRGEKVDMRKYSDL
jgi:hypothetical protein